MKKLFFITLFLMLLPVPVYAHSGLASSYPADGETGYEAVTEITIEFDLPIQQGNLRLMSENGEEITILNVQIEGLTLAGELEEELTAGDYKIEWDVISQDGHKVEGIIGFEAAGTEPSISETIEKPEKPVEVEPEPVETASSESEVASESDEAEEFPMFTAILLAVLVLAVILIVVVVRRK